VWGKGLALAGIFLIVAIVATGFPARGDLPLKKGLPEQIQNYWISCRN